jgi:hypothetical protein
MSRGDNQVSCSAIPDKSVENKTKADYDEFAIAMMRSVSNQQTM